MQFGLDFDVAQLPAQTDDILGQVEQRSLDGSHLAFNPRAGDRQLAGFVDQPVDQVGTHPQGGPLCGRFAVDFLRAGGSTLFGSRDRLVGGVFGSQFRCRRVGYLDGRICRFTMLQALDNLHDHVEGIVDVVDQLQRRTAGLLCFLHARFNGVCEFAKIHRAGHARATFERMEQSRQSAHGFTVRGIAAPGV
ncbi:MAG: hypothetical protein AW09_003850 [Candidatus Accumulibacter phosphatis]|uniref:Uncharacterized protein n=1 Tax=Candidatus Accumulibacter phosphatis TaxID=327160 RepID=A0A080M1H3_9PROT|nr:MAG: hypothetical protein AW09_003850 [Candidatus Accumulibacter phosphatis]